MGTRPLVVITTAQPTGEARIFLNDVDITACVRSLTWIGHPLDQNATGTLVLDVPVECVGDTAPPEQETHES